MGFQIFLSMISSVSGVGRHIVLFQKGRDCLYIYTLRDFVFVNKASHPQEQKWKSFFLYF